MSKIYFAKFNINEKIHEVYSQSYLLQKFLKDILTNLNTDLVICYDEKKKEIREIYSIEDLKNADDPESVQGPEENCSYYKFMYLDFIQKDMDEIINGRIIRIYAEDWHRYRVTEAEGESLNDYHTPDRTTYVTFSFNVTKEIIGFAPKFDFRKEKFIHVFKLLVEKCVPSIGDVELILLVDNEKLEKKFKKINKLTDLSVDFIPPNASQPDVDDILEGIYPFVGDTNATKVTLEVHAPSSKPIDKASSLVKAMMKMANKAYAIIKAKGKTNENDVITIDTSKDVIYFKEVQSEARESITVLNEETQIAMTYYTNARIAEATTDEVIADE